MPLSSIISFFIVCLSVQNAILFCIKRFLFFFKFLMHILTDILLVKHFDSDLVLKSIAVLLCKIKIIYGIYVILLQCLKLLEYL